MTDIVLLSEEDIQRLKANKQKRAKASAKYQRRRKSKPLILESYDLDVMDK